MRLHAAVPVLAAAFALAPLSASAQWGPAPAPSHRDELPSFGQPSIVPTFGLMAAAHGVTNRPELSTSSLGLWAGARFHPFVARTTPFVAFGTEVSWREVPGVEALPEDGERRTYVELVPQMRFGVAFLREPTAHYGNQVIPNAEIYGIAGWRAGNRESGHAFRVGAGVSAPVLMMLWGTCELPLPSMVEVTADIDGTRTGEREYALRFGWHF